MIPPVVVLDACVLYPAPLRDFLMHLALLDVFQARWTDEIHDEWIRSVLAKRPDLTRAQLARTKELMNSGVRDCLVDDYEHLIGEISLPDDNDRHVVAAAIKSYADVVLTFNLRDFPDHILDRYELDAILPDTLLSKLFNSNKELFDLAFERQLASLKNPPKTAEELAIVLESLGLKKTIRKLRHFRQSR